MNNSVRRTAGRRVTVVSWNYHHGKRHCVSESVHLLKESGLLERLITNRYEIYDSDLKRISENPLYPSRIFYLILRVKNLVAKKYKKTQFREWLFDYFASRNLGKTDFIYLDAERFPGVVKVASNKGMTTMCYQRTAHTNYLTAVVKDESEKRNYITGYLDKSLNERRRACIDHADFILAHSEFVRDTDIANGRDEKTIKVVYGCVDTAIYQPVKLENKPLFIILLVGTDPLLKGLFYLLDAWNKIQNDLGDTQLWVIGNKPRDYDERYKGLENIKFLERQGDMVSIYQQASVLVQPSLVDAGPKAVTEAMASGLPVIVSNAIGYSEIVKDGINGYVVPARNHQLLAEKLEYCVAHPDEMKKMGIKARASVIKLTHRYHAVNVVDAVKSIAQSGAVNN